MSRLVFVALLLLFTSPVVHAQETSEQVKPGRIDQIDQAGQAEQAGQAKKSSGPIVIVSDSLQADGASGTATFIGSVVATGDEMNMKADRMKVFYAKGGGELERLEADGSVKLIREGRIVTSERAVYNATNRVVVFTGNARAVEDGNVLVGTKITYMIDEDRYEVEGSKIFIENTTGRPGGRQGGK